MRTPRFLRVDSLQSPSNAHHKPCVHARAGPIVPMPLRELRDEASPLSGEVGGPLAFKLLKAPSGQGHFRLLP